MVREQRVLDLAAGNVVLQDEILVGDDGCILQANVRTVGPGAVAEDLVRERAEILDGYAGVELHVDGNVVPGTLVRSVRASDRRRDARSIGDAVGVRRPAATLLPDRHGAGNVARSDHHGEDELIIASLVL